MLPSVSSIGNFARVHMPGERSYANGPRPAASSVQPIDWETRGEVRRHLLGAVRALDRLEQSLGATQRGAATAPVAESSADIGLSTAPDTAATLVSSEQVNASPNSFTQYAPQWSGLSSAAMILDGEYNGDQGSGTLTFEVRRGGVHGSNDLRIRMRDTEGKSVETIRVRASDPLDEVYTFSNGIQFTLSAGALIKNDTLSVDVFEGVGTSVDPDKPLDGTGDDDARLESAFSVTDGSFTVNGTSIAVSSGDSLNDVLARITASAAGVTASFDPGTEQVQLTQNNAGSEHSIVLGADTSGFLAATKLAGASVTPGTDYEPEAVIASVAALSGVSSGTVTINGTDIGVDVDSDSLVDVINRINASGAGVNATLSTSAQRVTITRLDASEDLVLDEGSTGLFNAINIASTTYAGTLQASRTSKARSYVAADALESVSGAFDKLFSGPLGQRMQSLSSLRSRVEGVLGSAAEANGERVLSRMGVDLSLHETGRARLSVDTQSRRHFAHQLQREVAPLQDLFLGRGSEGGLITELRAALDAALSSLGRQQGAGALVDLVA